MKSKILKFIVYLILIYLFISAIYVLLHIDFGTPSLIQGDGFSERNNMIRIFMGLPKTFTTYEGVPPIFLIQVLVKLVFGIILLIFVNKKIKNNNREEIKEILKSFIFFLCY